ncbi:DMT family transporter [Bosea sp. R86505]|uniref:DMT family transporter n=1 Tax=Bosea sp. R86505 TaxID=3101710 RepID=UPI00366ABFBA
MSEVVGDTAARARRDILIGAALMVVSTFCFVSLDSILKALAARHDVLFLAWGRNLFQVVYLVAVMPLFGARRMLVTRHPVIQLCRGAALVGTTVFIVLALKSMPLAQTYAITFSAPLIATILAMVFLKERPSLKRWALILIGFCGVMVALQPTAPGAGGFLVFPLAMALANAGYHVLTRAIAADEDPLAMLFQVGFFALLITSLALPWSWSQMEPWEWGVLAVGGAFGTLAHLLLIEAFRRAPTAVISPMIYSQIIAACLIGYLAFGEVPTLATLLGAAIVVASGVALIRSRG